MVKRFSIRFDRWYRVLSSVVLMPPASTYVEVLDGQVEICMSWGFRARFPITAISKTSMLGKKPLSRGVHGWDGRWLVNGSGRDIVVLDLAPVQSAKVLGVAVQLRQLMVSLEDPDSFRKLISVDAC